MERVIMDKGNLTALSAEQKYQLLSEEEKERAMFVIAYLIESQYIAQRSFCSLPLIRQSRG